MISPQKASLLFQICFFIVTILTNSISAKDKNTLYCDGQVVKLNGKTKILMGMGGEGISHWNNQPLQIQRC